MGYLAYLVNATLCIQRPSCNEVEINLPAFERNVAQYVQWEKNDTALHAEYIELDSSDVIVYRSHSTRTFQR